MKEQYFKLTIMGVYEYIYNAMIEGAEGGAIISTDNKYEYIIEGRTTNIIALSRALKRNYCTIVH